MSARSLRRRSEADLSGGERGKEEGSQRLGVHVTVDSNCEVVKDFVYLRSNINTNNDVNRYQSVNYSNQQALSWAQQVI